MTRPLLLLLTLLLSACAQPGPMPDPTKPHHRDGRFQNNYLDFKPKGTAELLRWQLNAARQGLPPAAQEATPEQAPDLLWLQGNRGATQQAAVTWLGHASVLAQLGGLNVVTDPMFSERASPVRFLGPRRAQAPALQPPQLPRIDLVLVSHNHYDHLDAASLVALNEQAGGPPQFVVPLGVKALLAGWGIDKVVELDWWQRLPLMAPKGRVEVVFTPVQHWSARGISDRMRTLWGGYAVLAPDCHLYFAGDTGYSKDFADTAAFFEAEQRERGGFDIALIPVGAYEPRWFMKDQHVNPSEAVQLFKDLRAKRALGIHWGTFALTDEALDEPPRALARAKREQGIDDAFFLLAIGETRRIPHR